MFKLLYALPLVTLLGCTASHQINNAGGTKLSRLDPARKVFVAVPKDGAYGTTTYSGSGQITAQAIATAFSKYAARVQVAEGAAEVKEMIVAAKSASATYLAPPD